MRLPLSWLKQYVGVEAPPDELAERLTLLGVEVESVQLLGGEFQGVVVAEILDSQKHPNADRLSVCRVADGQGERQIVCGATNYKVGDKVPLALPGCILPASPPLTIKISKMRGVESRGMLCSGKELGLSDDAQGLLILPLHARVGQAFAEFLGRPAGDVIYDLEITPNRPDLNSVIGLAREISAFTGAPLLLPQLPAPAVPPSGAERTGDRVGVRIDEPDLCGRYVARIIRGVKIGPSPAWLRQALEKVGLRSINNVVDVTNFVMWETGQPLHAFDYHLLSVAPGTAKPVIVVRRAGADERFTTLDGQERRLTSDMLLIADETKAIALAGVMGGHNTEINLTTTDVLLECAWFKPENIRRTAQRLDVRTDASYRFERGADIEIGDWASLRAAQLIVETAGGALLADAVDAYPQPRARREIKLRTSRTRALLGVDITPDAQVQFLTRLGLELVQAAPLSPSGGEGARRAGEGPSLTFGIPSFRVDLKREIDLIEEIARLYGVDRIPATPPRGAVGANPYDAVHDQLAEARRILTGLGLTEAQGQTLISKEAARHGSAEALALENPMSSDMDVLRPSLIPGLLEALRHNLHHKVPDAGLFELGRVFFPANNSFQEQRRVALARTGRRSPPFWTGTERDEKTDLFDLKGLIEEFLDQFGVRGVACLRRSAPSGLYLDSATVHLGKQTLGELGQLTPVLARLHDLRDPVFLAELDLDMLLARRVRLKVFKPLPAFPAIRRDIALFVPEGMAHDQVLQAIKQGRPAHLESVELFDVFRGSGVPAGHKSMAYALTYRHPERTLTDAEVNPVHDAVVDRLKQQLQAIIRE